MSQKKYASLQTLQTFLTGLRNTFSELSHKHTLSDFTDYVVDTELSADSSNPVQNKVLDAEFDAISTAINALDLVIDGKANVDHDHNDTYYTKEEVECFEFITTDDIDAICGQIIKKVDATSDTF